jgi:hypothetical protein
MITRRIAYEREGDEHTYTIDVQTSYNPGEHIEPGHPFNGYGRGWHVEHIEVQDETGKFVTDQFNEKEIVEIYDFALKNIDWDQVWQDMESR